MTTYFLGQVNNLEPKSKTFCVNTVSYSLCYELRVKLGLPYLA